MYVGWNRQNVYRADTGDDSLGAMHRVLLVLVVSACSVDAPLPPPDHGLIGSWRLIPAKPETPIEQREVLVFGADGRYTKQNLRKALHVGVSAWLGMLAGLLAKVVLGCMMVGVFVVALLV